ncbi:hypothetical protein L3X38_016061 [Prunus dulcis]|uniref:Uncharacterized protein n=1 Tax=Prunus dulcis TaxID=3755 RepID=A0AAD4W6C9_PRUDU|nr:hypothetical protein L3X38_016061 [Prunus dulcis]
MFEESCNNSGPVSLKAVCNKDEIQKWKLEAQKTNPDRHCKYTKCFDFVMHIVYDNCNPSSLVYKIVKEPD